MSLVTIISSTYFTCLCDSNVRFLLGDKFLYVIALLPILCKQLVTACQGTVFSTNSEQAASDTPLTAGFLRLSIDFFSLVQFSSFHHKSLFHFAAGSSNSLVTVAVSCSDELLAPDSMGINSSKPKTKFVWTVTLIYFLCSSCPAFSSCGLIHFRFLPLFFLEYS